VALGLEALLVCVQPGGDGAGPRVAHKRKD
jgi:hypothetical protein